MSEMPGKSWDASLPNGVWLQVYLASMRGETDVKNLMQEVKRLKLAGVIFHGGAAAVAPAAQWARDEGVTFAFSFGLDGSGSGASKGKAIGTFLSSINDVAFALLDAEGAWDSKPSPDLTDEANALALGHELRLAAPTLVIGDQPWFAMLSHGHERAEPKPLGEGGTFAGFPSDEFASFLQFRMPQLYFRNFSGPNAYNKVRDWHERDWATHDTSLARMQLDRPRSWTLQGYGHRDRPQDLVDVMLRSRDRLTVLWWDAQYRDQWAVTATCIEAVQRIIGEDQAPPDRVAIDCVKSWQRSLGMPEIQCDGACGWDTLSAAKLGTKPT